MVQMTPVSPPGSETAPDHYTTTTLATRTLQKVQLLSAYSTGVKYFPEIMGIIGTFFL